VTFSILLKKALIVSTSLILGGATVVVIGYICLLWNSFPGLQRRRSLGQVEIGFERKIYGKWEMRTEGDDALLLLTVPHVPAPLRIAIAVFPK
jgi:hypothetical protein